MSEARKEWTFTREGIERLLNGVLESLDWQMADDGLHKAGDLKSRYLFIVHQHGKLGTIMDRGVFEEPPLEDDFVIRIVRPIPLPPKEVPSELPVQAAD